MTRSELVAVIKQSCVPNGKYDIQVLGKYIQQSYNLEDIFEVKSALLAMLNSQDLELTDDFKVTVTKK